MVSISQFAEQLRKRGYSVEPDARVTGESGQVHSVDGLALGGDGGKVIWLERRGHPTMEIIKAFAIAMDVGAEACYVTDILLADEDRKLAESYKMRVLEKDG